MTATAPRRRAPQMPSRVSPLLATLLGAGLVLLPAAPARAEVPRAQDRHPTDGVDRVIHDVSGEGDATSIELNPALLADIEGVDLSLLGYRSVSNYTRGSGFGGFFASNLGFGLAMGLGVQVVRPQLRLDGDDFDADFNPDLTKLSLAFAGDFDQAAFGVGVHGVRVQGQWLQRPDLDIGAMVRMFDYGSAGINARLSSADLDSTVLPAHLSLTGELALRPLGTHHLELAAAATQQVLVSENGGPVQRVDFSGFLPRGRVAVRWQGWALKAEVEQVRASVLDPVTFERVEGQKALRGGVALEGSWDVITAGAGLHAGVSEGLDGVGFSARLHSRERGRVVWTRELDAERFELADVSDERSLIEMLERLQRAEQAGERSVLVVDARGTGAGWASLHELREALVRVRNAGGHVFAYLETASLKDYYVASVAEQVFVHPAGSLETYGIGSTSLYLKGALDKVGVKAEVIKVDEYKSAGERFTHTAPSEPDRAQRQEIQRDLYATVVHDVAQARGLSLADVRHRFDEAPWGPHAAVDEGLADEVVFRDELLERISERIGAKVEFAEFYDTTPRLHWAGDPYVAVVLVEDAIVDGKSRKIPLFGLGFAGGDTIAKTLHDLREDPDCRGVVLRVNSPGGSALASDVIWREVALTAQAHAQDPRFSAPIVVSMGDVAASGGYYVSAGAPVVLADPMTITGSIGVISLHFDVSGLLETLGISTFTLAEGKNATIGEPYSAYTEDQRARIEASIRRTYDLFRERVATARGMTPEKVDELGRGHVYSGTDAKALGLVDEMGGLYDAIALVRSEAGLPDWRPLKLRVLPEQPSLLDLILGSSRGPRGRVGPVGRAVERKRSAREAASLRGALPLALDEALSRIPLSLLFLPQGQAQAIMPAVIELE
ncbi:S49 family peptidase [Paraliomyxa miuraensis]|uniref:S49 family peptidase n=1 Tax=Paraliomyxa miuraensis TaxID=376150 RepID=UPI00225BDD9E|nr:S49 family peptidase [Paraliomyxa miuraensis]MCX4239955.1 S49 family peptidase [Paraliomyxa miuraensis]